MINNSLNSTSNVDFLSKQVNYNRFKDLIEQEEKRTANLKVVQKVITYLFLTIMAIVILFPFYWMIITALKSYEEVGSIVPTLFPENFEWSNFIHVLTDDNSNFFKILSNTIIVSVLSTIGTLIITIFSAYAFSMFEFKGKNALFGVFLATMMIPMEMLIITNLYTMKVLNLLNTHLALILPFLVSVFYIFFLRQTFKQIPKELYYAAKVDGAKDFKYLRKIMIPLAKPTLITIILLNFISAWNSYTWPSVVNKADMQLVSNWLRNSFTDGFVDRPMYQYQMAGAVIVSIPVLIIFVILKKYIIQSVSRSGIKG